jgi:hypothetical protein
MKGSWALAATFALVALMIAALPIWPHMARFGLGSFPSFMVGLLLLAFAILMATGVL